MMLIAACIGWGLFFLALAVAVALIIRVGALGKQNFKLRIDRDATKWSAASWKRVAEERYDRIKKLQDQIASQLVDLP